MVNSMTGYGRASVTFGDKTITAELRSVNNRYLDCTVRCPRLYAFLEEPAKARLKAAGVTRGKVDMFIGIEYAAGDSEVCINAGAVNAYLAAYVIILILGTLLVSIDGFGLETSLTAILATFNNIGPGLAAVGPTCTFANFSNFSKFIMIFK